MQRLVSNKLFNFLFTLSLIVVVLNYQNGHFFVAKAFNNKVNIIPGDFSLVQNDGSEMRWKKVENAFNQDLNVDSGFHEFDIANSAYIVYRGNNNSDSTESAPEETEQESELPTRSGGGSSGGGGKSTVNEEENDEGSEVEETDNDTDDTDEQPDSEEEDQAPVIEGETTVKGIDNSSESENQDSGEATDGDAGSGDSDDTDTSSESEDSTDSDSTESDDSEESNDPESSDASDDADSSGADSESSKDAESASNDSKSEESNSDDSSDSSDSSESSDSSSSKDSSNDSGSEPEEKSNPDSETSLIEKIFSPITSLISIFSSDNILKTKEASAQNDYLSQELIFSDFFVPISADVDDVGVIALNLSFAATSEFENDSLKIEYAIDDQWNELEEIIIDQELSNVNTFGYFSYQLPDDVGLDDIKNLNIRLSYINPSYLEEKNIELYLDALWLELEYEDETLIDEEVVDELLEDEIEGDMIEGENFDIDQLSEKINFQVGESPRFNFKFAKRKKMLKKLLSVITEVFSDEYREMRIDARVLEFGSKDNEMPIDINVRYIEDGEFEIELGSLPRQFKPGKHKLEIVIEDNGEIFSSEKDFTWGVLAMNFNKTIYTEDEVAYLQMAVLTDMGDTICNARLVLEIESPDGDTETLSTDDGGVEYSGKCGPNNVIDVPDYFAFYDISGIGTYRATLTAYTENGEREITDSFEVRRSVLIDIERVGPTRIYPLADYETKFIIRPNVDYVGEFHEYVPSSFEIVEQKQDGRILNDYDEENVIERPEEKEIVWQVDWKVGEEYILTYTMDAPDISPEYYLLGPAKVTGLVYWEDEEENVIEPELIDFEEMRQWQIASDAVDWYDNDWSNRIKVTIDSSQVAETNSGFPVLATTTSSLLAHTSSGGLMGVIDGSDMVVTDSNGTTTIDYEREYYNSTTGEIALWIKADISSTVDKELYIYYGNASPGSDQATTTGVWDSNFAMVQHLQETSGTHYDSTSPEYNGTNNGSTQNATGQIDGANSFGGAGYISAGQPSGLDITGDITIGAWVNVSGGTGNQRPIVGKGDTQYMLRVGGGDNFSFFIHDGSWHQINSDGTFTEGEWNYVVGRVSGTEVAMWVNGVKQINTDTGGITASAFDLEIGRNSQVTTRFFNGLIDEVRVSDTARSTGWIETEFNNQSDVNSFMSFVSEENPDVVASATGTQTSQLDVGSHDNYIGGKFVFTEMIATSSITSITITESGTVDAQNDLSSIRLYYDLDTSVPYDCVSESYASGDSQFGATSTSFDAANGTSTFSGALEVSTVSSMCVYVVLDVEASATKNETVEIEINNPSIEVVLSSGVVEPTTSVEISGSSSLYSPDVTVMANAQRKSDNFTSIINQAWTEESQVYLNARANDLTATSGTMIDLYFETENEDSSFVTATTPPASSCSSGTAYNSCSSKTWKVTATSPVIWYNPGWGYRRKITINASQVSTTTSAFAVLATTTDSIFAHTGSGGHMGLATGGDIVITDSDGITAMDYEREFYDSATGEIVLWIETDISESANKDLYIYYGNAAASDQSKTDEVWDSGYLMVQHLQETGGNHIDSVGNYDCTNNGTVQDATGVIDGANNFDTNTDDLNCGQVRPTDAITFSVWAKSNITTTQWEAPGGSSANGEWLDGYGIFYDSNSTARFYVNNYAANFAQASIDTEEWHYIVGTYDRFAGGTDEIKIYVNGALGSVVDDHANAINYNGGNFTIGEVGGWITDWINGVIDEVRISNIARDADWIQTEYDNQKDVDSFLAFSATEESSDTVYFEGTANIPSLPDRGSSTDSTLGYKWQVLACNNSSSCSFWNDLNPTLPNFKVDNTPPTAPGSLTLSTTTATAIELNFGGQTTETNFSYYKIFYKDGLSGVDTTDTSHSDSSLDYIDYNGATTTAINNLVPDTQYVINIFAYDFSGNKTAATELIVTTLSTPNARARSVSFFAGNYSGNGSTGQSSDTDQTFSTFNFSLAEVDADIRNAYILFEAQFEAYNPDSLDYTGYNLTFDSCEEPCTADAFSGTGRILKDDSTVLAFDETESNQVRLLLDVTNEAQLDTYLGNSANMEAQVGYRIETGTTTTSIANAKATLIVTYAFNDDASTDITNTVVYPLESTAGGDSGSRLSVQTDDCIKDSDCPLFDYNMEIPEFSTRLSQWFQVYNANDGHGGNDISMNVNIEGVNIDSNTYIHESANGGTQGSAPQMIFSGVSGFSENTDQSLEYYSSSLGGGNYYVLGGEVVETYTASKSASTKTRTVSFPIGIITNGQNIATASSTVQVYFPENGSGSGVVTIQKAWFRILVDNYNTGNYSTTVSSSVGDNAVSGNYVYSYNGGGTVIKPSLNVIHIIPSGDYEELEDANASTPKTVVINTTNSNANVGGVSAELMITYTYASESAGYLTSLNLFGGQSDVDGNATSTTDIISNSVFPELKGTKTLRSAALVASYLVSAGDGGMPGDWFTMDANVSTANPVCTNAFNHRDDGRNSFTEFYRDVTSSIFVTDDLSYSACFSNSNGSDNTAGAKMNASLFYTYQWDAPPTTLTQNAFRWYDNIDDTEPTTAKAPENTSISGINAGDILRLRMNLAVTKTDMATSTQAFRLQFAEGSDCTGISSTTWEDVGGIAGQEAWLGYNNLDPADGVSLLSTSILLASSTVPETYEETNSSGSNPRGVEAGGYAEWDWVVYNNFATSSSDYCFRMIKGDSSELTDYLPDSYPKLTTAPSNTAPASPVSLGQYRDDGVTVIANASWINVNDLLLTAAVTDLNINEVVSLYFELIPNSSGFTTATTMPASACLYGTAYDSCASKMWLATSTVGDYRTNAFTATTSVIDISTSVPNYKWQVLSCDDDGACSSWVKPGSNPNFRIDMTPPTPPGALSFADVNATDATVVYGASTTEDNFVEYKIFYKVGASDVTELDVELDNGDLDYQNYNTATSTLANALSADTQYVFNIWAYDIAGNKASSTTEVSTTTIASFSPPSGFVDNLSAQKTDGSGIVDMVILTDDPDNDDTLRAKVFYEAGDTCAFGTMTKLTIDETDENITATYGDPDVDNVEEYQVGVAANWILSSPGSNYVFFDWTSKVDIPAADGDYCLGLVVSDGIFDQVATHTKVLTIDNVNPTVPGSLSTSTKSYSSITLDFGAESTDTRFDAYKIFYKEGTSGVTEGDNEFNKTDDPNLDSENYGTAATTTITGLNPNTTYVFNIWAYDTNGNKASSSGEFVTKTNAAPVNISADNQFFSDGLTVINNGIWIDDNNVVFSASVHDQDAEDLMSFYFELITATSTFSSITSPPQSACATGTPFIACANKIWLATTTASNIPTDWYSEDWLFRKKITIDSSKVLADETDFPVLVVTTDADLVTYARSDGYDILFTDSSGIALVSYEREYYNPLTGKLEVWIKTDISSTVDTVLYMYYGNTGATTDPSTPSDAWDSSYQSVLHLSESVVDEGSASDIHFDSSGNNNHGDQSGNNEKLAQIYQGQEFDGINDIIQVDDVASLDLTDEVTLEFWLDGTTSIDAPIQTTSDAFSTEGADTFVVPDGVTSITVKTWGAGGGGGGGGNGGDRVGGGGGGGGFAQGDMTVTPGETLNIRVGGPGEGGSDDGTSGEGAGGGGYSAVLRSTTFLIMAGGGAGGGGAANDAAEDGGGGGGGSGANGANGAAGRDDACDGGNSHGDFGNGGTTSGVGVGGSGCSNATDGEPGVDEQGGAGGNANSSGSGAANEGLGGLYGGGNGGERQDNDAGGGGGGGGQYGGGGGEAGNDESAGGAGGGSGKTDGLTSVTTGTGGTGNTGAGTSGTAANNGDGDYAGNAGLAGNGGGGADGADGNPGRVVIVYNYDPEPTIGKDDAYQMILDKNQIFHAFINDQEISTTTTEAWHHVVLTYDRTGGGTDEMKLYIDGVLEATGDYSTVINSNANNFYIGENLNGAVDELRISDIARSANWIKTQYNNQSAVGTFLTITDKATVVSYFESVLAVSIPDNPDYSSGWKWQVMACDEYNDCSPWDDFNSSIPNFKIDTTDPSAPGILVENSNTSNSVVLDFGAVTDEDNFSEYKIFYSSSLPVTESDSMHASTSDSDLAYIDYNSTSNTTISGLSPNTTYFFNIWAYDIMGHSASSTVMSVVTGTAASTPGVFFYTKNDSAVYYNIWDGTNWGGEQSSGNITAAGDNIRHIRTIRSDDGGRVGILFKTWDGTNQEWWGTVYRFAADDFVDSTQLGGEYAAATNNQLITGCIAPLSGGEFMIVRNNNGSDGTSIYSWNGIDGWVSEAAGPSPIAVLNGCELERRPGSDNYILMTYDDDSDVGSSYYYGGSTYANSWTSWTEHSIDEEDIGNYVGQAFFDKSDNTRGAISYSNSSTNDNTIAKYFIAGDSTLNFGGAVNSPTAGSDGWNSDFVHGEFAPDPTGTGIGYFSGRDITGQLNIYKVDVTNPTIAWSTVTNGDNISSGDLYSETNDSQKPFASTFYKGGKGLLVYNVATDPSSPYYSVITSSGNTASAPAAVPGADANLWSRAKLYNDPYEYETVAIYQNDDVDYSAVFWNGGADQFYSSGNQAWTELVTGAGAGANDEATSFAFTGFNAPPNSPVSMIQYKTDATVIANQGWTNETTVNFEIEATDIDTYESIAVYLNLVIDTDSLSTATSAATFSACASTTAFDICGSKIWAVATSSVGDYSIVPFTATATITTIASSTVGYKWQTIACDDDDDCSSWASYNAIQPNLYIDDKLPTEPGNLTDTVVDSNSVTLQFGSASIEDNFSEYIVFYKIGSSDVSESDSSWTQADDNHLSDRIYDGFTETVVTGLSSSTQYVFNIWSYDLAGNTASATIEVSTTTTANPNMVQSSYLFENDNETDVDSNSASVAASTTLSGVYIGERINARIQMENSGGDVLANKTYKLQFENTSDSPGTWIDVGAATEVSYSWGLSGVNGDSITTNKATANTNTWNNGTWHENSNTTESYSLVNGLYTEFVFAIETVNSLVGDTYRLRLYNDTDSATLNNYDSYPMLVITATDDKRYSKDMVNSLAADTSDFTYFMDHLGYTNVLIDDNSDYDEIVSSSEYPVALFATKHTNGTDSANSTWNGQSSVAPSVNNVHLEVYRYGSVNDWESVSVNNSVAADTDFDLSATINSNVTDYYDGGNWMYWRVYQDSGSQNFKSDYFDVNFSAPTPVVEQIHYRWRNDDGNQTNATWLEAEDTGSPTLGSAFGIGSSSRLRLSVSNMGSGDALNYTYRLEYASSSDGCVTDPGNWITVPVNDTTEHFEMVVSSNFGDSDPTTAQFTNSESYVFVAGDMVEDPSNITGNITLAEDRYSEIEYMIEATSNSQIAGTYCFRVTDGGAELDAYDIYPVLTIGGSTNEAPAFSVLPTDNGSASTSPTVYNTNLSFNATAGDSEGDSYYLAICKSDAIFPGSDSAPTCTGGNWCVSGETSSSAEASCDYNATSSSETLDWYAFVCDKKAGFGISKCSASSQGAGSILNDSPFVINHPPDFTSVVTTVDNIDPGATTSVTAFVTDNDIAGTADTMDMFVCTKNNAVAGVGCAGVGNKELCSGLATTTPNATCSFGTSTPATAGDWTYYTFIFDSHNFGATDNSRSNTYTINNTIPVLGTFLLNDGNDITLNIKGAADTNISLVNTSVVDLNGCNSIVSAVGAIYMSNATNGYNCSVDENDCYQITVGDCVRSDCDSIDDITATYTCAADMKYFAAPTDNSSGNPNEPYGWMSYLRVYDGENYSGPSTSTKVELMTGSGIEVVENEISFGFWGVGDNTGNTNSTSTIVNISNSPIDSNISGTNMTGNPSGLISVDKIKWSLSGFNYVFDGTPLTGAGIKVEILSPKATTTVSDVKDEIYWGIGIPIDADSSAYTGVNTFSVVLDIDDW